MNNGDDISLTHTYNDSVEQWTVNGGNNRKWHMDEIGGGLNN